MCLEDSLILEDEITVKDFLRIVSDTHIAEAQSWLRELHDSFLHVQGFYSAYLTSERTKFIMGDLCVIISQSLSRKFGRNRNSCFEEVWRAHAFMTEFRQKAVALGADVDAVAI